MEKALSAHEIVTGAANFYCGDLRSTNLRDPNAKEQDEEGNPTFTLACQVALHDHKVIVRSSDFKVAIEINLNDTILAETPLSIGRSDRVMMLKPTSESLVGIGLPVFSRDGILRESESQVIHSWAFTHSLQDLVQAQMDSLHVYRNKIIAYLCPKDLVALKQSVDAMLHIVTTLGSERTPIATQPWPESFSSIQPLIEEWSIFDDDLRAEKIAATSRAELIRLRAALGSYLSLINSYLNEGHIGEIAQKLQAFGETVSEIGVYLDRLI